MSLFIPTLHTARLILRPLVATDVPAFAALNADPEVVRFISPTGQPLSSEDSWRLLAMFIGHWHLRGFGMFAVAEVKDPEKLIGRIGAHQPDGWPDFEIGWALTRESWGHGFATEAVTAAIRYAFEVVKRPRVISLIHPDNARSRAVAERVGQRRIGEWTMRGECLDLYALDRETWAAHNGAH